MRHLLRCDEWTKCRTAADPSTLSPERYDRSSLMRVLVTGSEGYIGARLVPILIAHGLDVVGLDTGFYRDGWLYSDNKGMPVSASTIAKDLRHVDDGDLKGF